MTTLPPVGAKLTIQMKTNLSPQFLHDLRSPLNQIIGYAEILREDTAGQPANDLTRDLEKIHAAGLRMLALIEENFISINDSTVPDLVDEEEEDAAAGTVAPRGPLAVAPGVLLVVDDDAINRDVLSRRLKRQGHDVTTVASGKDALEAMRRTEFDLVLLDIMMPDMDGYEVLGHIKADERLSHIPVVMISALHEVESVVRCIEAGAEDYLAKPFNPTLLQARIGACLEKKRGRDRETVLFHELQKNYRRLQEVEKLRDDMRNMIVHDLRTPLTAVIMGVDMLASHGALSDEQREMVALAASGGRTLLGMINDLLDVEKMESGTTVLQYEQLSADALVADAIAQVGTLASEGQTSLVTKIEPGLPPFAGDPNKLSRTLVNLLANAIKFTRAGTVTVCAFQKDAGHVGFSVRDTGQGIPAEAFERIFEKFGQLDGRKVGTGLGLAFCKLAVEAHHGHISVESTPGVGSTFSFNIPVAAPGE